MSYRRRRNRRNRVLASIILLAGTCILVDNYGILPERVATQTRKGHIVQIVSGGYGYGLQFSQSKKRKANI